MRDNLEKSEVIGISQLYRDVQDSFITNKLMKDINEKLSKNTHILNTTVQIDVESLKSIDGEKVL